MKQLDKMEVAFGDVSSVPITATEYVGYLFGTTKTKERIDAETGEVVPAKEVQILYLQDAAGHYYATRSEGLTRQLEQVVDQLDAIPSIKLKVVDKDLGKGRKVKRFVRV